MYVRTLETAGFTFDGANNCVPCTGDIMRDALTAYPQFPAPADFDTHDLVGQYARATGHAIYAPDEFHTYDTSAFDSGDVPKAFTSGSVTDGESCDQCGSYLV